MESENLVEGPIHALLYDGTRYLKAENFLVYGGAIRRKHLRMDGGGLVLHLPDMPVSSFDILHELFYHERIGEPVDLKYEDWRRARVWMDEYSIPTPDRMFGYAISTDKTMEPLSRFRYCRIGPRSQKLYVYQILKLADSQVVLELTNYRYKHIPSFDPAKHEGEDIPKTSEREFARLQTTLPPYIEHVDPTMYFKLMSRRPR